MLPGNLGSLQSKEAYTTYGGGWKDRVNCGGWKGGRKLLVDDAIVCRQEMKQRRTEDSSGVLGVLGVLGQRRKLINTRFRQRREC